MNLKFGISYLMCGMVFIAISIPLVKKKVPMNAFYGFRIAKALSSDENWYAINHYGGRQLIQWAVLLIVIGVLYFIFPIERSELPGANTFLAVAPIVICAIIPIIKTIIYARRL